MKNQTSQYWFQTSKFKIILIVAAIVAVILVVMFSEQIGNLLDRDASEAGTLQTIELDSSNLPLGTTGGSMVINAETGRLELDPNVPSTP